MLAKSTFADGAMSQVGEAQTGNVGNAANDTDVERGKSIQHLQFWLSLMVTYSEDMVADGRSGPNRGSFVIIDSIFWES
jgi:hypothetical protein